MKTIVSLRSRLPVAPLLLLSLCACFAPSLSAHHGTSGFDGNSIITLEGRVVEFQWTNPHSTLVIAVTEADGSERDYLIEGDGPSILQPLGVTRDSFPEGTRVITYVSPPRREGGRSVLGREVILEDGELLTLSVAYARQAERRNPPVTDSVLGAWVPDHRTLFEFVQTRADWAVTPAGEASLAAYDIDEPFAQTECIPATAPTLMMYPTANVLTDQGSHIELQADWMGAARTIYMDGREHPPADQTFLQGHSIGHYEEGTLIINTRNFSPNPIGNMFGLASGLQKELREYLSVNDDGSSLTYRYELSDPEYLETTVSGSYQWHYRPDVSVSSVACDLEAASRHLNE